MLSYAKRAYDQYVLEAQYITGLYRTSVGKAYLPKMPFNCVSYHILESVQNTESNPWLRNSSCMADVFHFSIHLSVTAVIGVDLDWLSNI